MDLEKLDILLDVVTDDIMDEVFDYAYAIDPMRSIDKTKKRIRTLVSNYFLASRIRSPTPEEMEEMRKRIPPTDLL